MLLLSSQLFLSFHLHDSYHDRQLLAMKIMLTQNTNFVNKVQNTWQIVSGMSVEVNWLNVFKRLNSSMVSTLNSTQLSANVKYKLTHSRTYTYDDIRLVNRAHNANQYIGVSKCLWNDRRPSQEICSQSFMFDFALSKRGIMKWNIVSVLLHVLRLFNVLTEFGVMFRAHDKWHVFE